MAEVAIKICECEVLSDLRWEFTFVQDQKLAATDDGPGKCQDLMLPDRKVSSPARNRGLQRDPPLFILALDREQTGIVRLTERIQVPSDRVARQLRDLRYDRDIRPQSVQVDLARRNSIIANVPFNEDASERHQGQRNLPAPSATDDAGTFTRLDVEAEAADNFGAVYAVLCGQVLDNKPSAGGPIGRRDT